MSVHILGIRHHGPGSARSLAAALEEIRPDAVLIEGPPDADDLIDLAANPNIQPPVALLIYMPGDSQQAVYYPFAVYSPEFQAIRWAVGESVAVQFMDLPQAHQFALATAEANPDPTDTAPPSPDDLPLGERVRRDPLGWLGRAAGYTDGERWWEHVIEQRRHDLTGVFEAVLEAMTELRQTAGTVLDDNEARREAHMRQTIRAAQAAGHERIAVVCGAWHAPALLEGGPGYATPQADAATLAGLPTVEVRATWIPWTYGRLSRESGYGAGVTSPGWYHHLWVTETEIVNRWLTKVAHLLRAQDLDASTAQVIDTARLAKTLTAIRGYTLPGLAELNESIQATMVGGAEEPMRLIHRDLVVGEMIGAVPPETPMVPLQRDLQATRQALDGNATKKQKTNDSDRIKYFRFDPQPTPLNLDLRSELDLQRSQLLHRLRLLQVPWGQQQANRSQAQGTFWEDWTLQWEPEFEIKLIEQSVWGNTVVAAATALVIDQARNADDLPLLTQLVDDVLHADLPDATEVLITQLKQKAAIVSDVNSLMEALPALVDVKTGSHQSLSVRQVTLEDVTDVIEGLTTRINVGLLNACLSLDDTAANEMYDRLVAVHEAVIRLHEPAYTAAWCHALNRVAHHRAIHGVVAGRAARLLLDSQHITSEEVARLLRLAISAASEPKVAAAWVEGFLKGSGLILLHADELFHVVDSWICGLSEEALISLLPLLRRTFSSFEAAERRQIGERVRHGELKSASPYAPDGGALADFDQGRADAMLPVLSLLLGAQEKENPPS